MKGRGKKGKCLKCAVNESQNFLNFYSFLKTLPKALQTELLTALTNKFGFLWLAKLGLV